MKKTIFAILAAVLCVFALCAVAVSAENAPETDIAGHNLSLNDSIHIIYYVDFQNVPENAEKGVLIWTSAQDEYIYGTQNAKITTIRGTTAGYSEYAFTGVAAKMMSHFEFRKYTRPAPKSILKRLFQHFRAHFGSPHSKLCEYCR